MKITLALFVLARDVIYAAAATSKEGGAGGDSPHPMLRKADDADAAAAAAAATGRHLDLDPDLTDEVKPDYWRPPIPSLGLTCIDNSIRAGGGKPLTTCITEGEAICIEYDHAYFGGTWTFGIKDSTLALWNPMNQIAWEFCTDVTHVCIGEDHGYEQGAYSQERPFMFFYDEKTNTRVGELTCDGTDGKVSNTVCNLDGLQISSTFSFAS